MSRPDLDTYFMTIVDVVATRSSCRRRAVGCVFVDKHKHIIATGYNGTSRGMPHCLENPCEGSTMASGTGLDLCNAVHAETNAMIQCRDVEGIVTAYISCSPCPSCLNMLMNTSTQRLVFREEYPGWEKLAKRWVASGRTWEIRL